MRRVGFFVLCVAVLIAARFVVGGSSTSSSSGGATRAPSPAATSTSTSMPTAVPGDGSTPSSALDAQATSFLNSYLAYLYGKASLAQVVDVTGSVRQGLPATLQNFTPAEQARGYTIENEQTTPPQNGSIDGTALIQESGGLATYTINFTMSQQNGVWVVDSVPTFTS
jgi:hypothetical protein